MRFAEIVYAFRVTSVLINACTRRVYFQLGNLQRLR